MLRTEQKDVSEFRIQEDYFSEVDRKYDVVGNKDFLGMISNSSKYACFSDFKRLLALVRTEIC